MPKKVMQKFLQSLQRDIASSYAVGDSYLSLKEIGERFGVSYKVAQGGVSELGRLGMLRTVRNKGTTILSKEVRGDFSRKKITLVSRGDWGAFNNSFLNGAKTAAAEFGITVEMAVNPVDDLSSSTFGDFLLQLNTDGVIGIGFDQGALGFCHAIGRGLDVVVDIPLRELSYLPCVHTDNFEHCKRAGLRLKSQGLKELLIVSRHDVNGDFCRGFMHERYLGMMAGVGTDGIKVTVAQLHEPRFEILVDNFFDKFGVDRAVFSLSMETNFILAAKYYQHGVKPSESNCIIYDHLNTNFDYYGLPSIPTIAPSMD